MGSAFDTWDVVDGAMYMGAGTSWEVIWLGLMIVICVGVLFVGGSHEGKAYKDAEKD